MRYILVDWLVQVHMKFKLAPVTLHLTVQIIDRFSSIHRVPRKKFQLVGVVALLIASKYEEIYPVNVVDLCYLCDDIYSEDELLDGETEILEALNYQISKPNAFPFLQRFLFVCGASKAACYTASYFLDRVIQLHSSLRFRSSLVAAAAVALAVTHPDVRGLDLEKNVTSGSVSWNLDPKCTSSKTVDSEFVCIFTGIQAFGVHSILD